MSRRNPQGVLVEVLGPCLSRKHKQIPPGAPGSNLRAGERWNKVRLGGLREHELTSESGPCVYRRNIENGGGVEVWSSPPEPPSYPTPLYVSFLGDELHSSREKEVILVY